MYIVNVCDVRLVIFGRLGVRSKYILLATQAICSPLTSHTANLECNIKGYRFDPSCRGAFSSDAALPFSPCTVHFYPQASTVSVGEAYL